MKVLFAVSNENISTQIVKRYQKEYKEIISYKNMYYFNAIIKELQRDKSYDRIVISEDLEPFANNNLDSIDKFLFEKLDNISDEATSINGKDIPIILLTTDRRTKSEPVLVKLFGIGIYNALLGQDRSTANVCALLNKPRSKKEAKIYYRIEADEVNYKSESEENVSEAEITNILNHYKRLGKDEDRYVESFNNIAAQYNEAQLRIITKFLPLNVKAVLEEKSQKYQSIMTFGDTSSTINLIQKKKEEEGLKIGFLNNQTSNRPSKPVIVPTAVKKVATKKNINKTESKINIKTENVEQIKNNLAETTITNNTTLPEIEKTIEKETEEIEISAKRGRGRPKKNADEDNLKDNVVKRGRGRPKKTVATQTNPNEEKVLYESEENKKAKNILPGFDEIEENNDEQTLPGFAEISDNDSVLPGFDEIEENNDEQTLPGFDEINDNDSILPGFDEIEENNDEQTLPGFDEINDNDSVLPGFDEVEENKYEQKLPGFDEIEENNGEARVSGVDTININEQLKENDAYKPYNSVTNYNFSNNYSSNDKISGLLTKEKKVVSFVGTTKNGTSFLVNNVAKCLSSMGIKTAILDLTTNRNSYYIYTDNVEKLRKIAVESIKKLSSGITNGINVDRYLDVYTALPGDEISLDNIDGIISTLVKNYSIILIDCDFNTPVEYFGISQEIYLVQTMDVLTIQPMTAFLRELKAKDILKPEKIRIVINKQMRVRGMTAKTIIKGLSFYNNPSMSLMIELFNPDTVQYCSIPFDEDVCSRYLEGLMDCKITINGYSKAFNAKLKELATMVYPLLGNKYRPADVYSSNNKFSSNINHTLEQMKSKY